MNDNFILLKNKKKFEIYIDNFKNMLKENNKKFNFSELLLNNNFLFNIVLYYKNQFNSIYLTFIKLDKKTINEITASSKKSFFFLDYKSENNYIEFKKYVKNNKENLLGKYLVILKYKIKNGELIDKENLLFFDLEKNLENEKIKINLSEAKFFFIDNVDIILNNLENILVCFMETVQANDYICKILNKEDLLRKIKNNNKLLNLLDLKEITINKNFKSAIKNEQFNKNKLNNKIFSKLFEYLKRKELPYLK